MNGFIGGMGGLSLANGHRGHAASNASLLAPRAPEGNPWAPVAYQLSSGPLPRSFVPAAPSSMINHRAPSYNGGPSMMSSYGRRVPRYLQRAPSQRGNNVVDLYELMAGRDVRTTVSQPPSSTHQLLCLT